MGLPLVILGEHDSKNNFWHIVDYGDAIEITHTTGLKSETIRIQNWYILAELANSLNTLIPEDFRINAAKHSH